MRLWRTGENLDDAGLSLFVVLREVRHSMDKCTHQA